MSNPHLIAPLPGSTPPALRISRDQRRALPPDLLREASRRLGIMSLLAAALWLVGSVLDHVAIRVMTHGDPSWLRLDADDAIAAVCVLVSFGLFAYARKGDRDPRFVLDLGLAYMVFTAAAIGLIIHWDPVPRDWHVSPMITWLGAVVLMFAAIVPSTPTKTGVAALIAVSMNPLAMLIARARGTWEFGSAGNVLLMHYPDYLLAGVAAVIAYVVTGLGQQIAKAREMGSYRLGELLGRGGMGEVYQATHRMLARPAAIKLIRPEMLGAGNSAAAQLAVKRFRREAEAAANLRSPHTVELYDFGVTEDQTLYFVMELLEGMDLESLVRRHGPVDAARVIHILRQVCDSLEEAHVSGLVHRDIKPANIHLGRVGLRHDFVKVLDFGLVKPAASASTEHSLATAAGLTPGTPAYMAPEMALGESVDGRADLYALGCVAYYLLTGQVVFDADTPFQMIARHLRAEPVPPSRRTERPVPPALERLVLDCLAKEADDRPQSAAELGRSLAAIEIEPWDDEQAMRWWKARSPVPDPIPAGN
ncbi:MAG TPA: serine/threonine-protein kinase [Gemmatimonadales bacterium]|nr:serine/threonine-protein kinase [Gemmatimonadales bacterium]